MEDLSNVLNNLSEGKHSFLAEPLLTPNANKTDCNRLVMFTSHFPQTEVLDQAESPLIFTNFENQVGEYTFTGFKKAEEDFEVIAKIIKNKYNYILIVKYASGKYDYIKRQEECWLVEHYGFKYNNSVIDSINKNDHVKKDTVLYRNGSYDENMNFGFGKNLPAIYLTYKNLTYEDKHVSHIAVMLCCKSI